MGTEVSYDPMAGPAVVFNATDVATLDIATAFERDSRPLVAQLLRWSSETRPPTRAGSLFDRDRYLKPARVFEQIRAARSGLSDDDVVGSVADITESLVFSEIDFFHKDEQVQDLWNQWAETVQLDAYMRACWRTIYTDSQVVTAMWWGKKTYRSRTEGPNGQPSRKTWDVVVPTHLSILDSLKVAPIGSVMFGQERLAYIATRQEAIAFDRVLGGRANPLRYATDDPPPRDPIVERLLLGRYEPTDAERDALRAAGADTENLYEMDPNVVWRHTLTKADYQRWADVRMVSAFAWLDMKTQLQQMDRAHLVGGANFIILVKKGTDKLPAEQEEVDALEAGMHVLARLPVIVGDHRLSVEIVTPKLDVTLSEERYDVIDARLRQRLFQTFGEDKSPGEMGKVIAEGLQSRRKMVRRTFEHRCLAMIAERNPGLLIPRMRFLPRHISLAFDQAWASFVLEQRQTKELSRDTGLGEFGFDQEEEAQLRKREAEKYDDTFKTQVPFSTPEDRAAAGGGAQGAGANRAAGRTGGGTRNGGGAAPGTGQGKAPRRPRKKSD